MSYTEELECMQAPLRHIGYQAKYLLPISGTHVQLKCFKCEIFKVSAVPHTQKTGPLCPNLIM